MFHIYYILIPLFCYLAGSIPTAYLVVKHFTGKDIRKIGSGNVGAMNTLRALKEKSGKLATIGFLFVVAIDMLKGVFAAYLVLSLKCFGYDIGVFLALAGFFVVLGHNYSVFLKFTGGKGAACLMGIMLFMDPVSFFVWGIPLVVCSIIAQVILERKNLIEKINWKKCSDFLMMIGGKQMAGRLVGLILGPIFLYFYNVQIFLPVAAGTILLLAKNISRFEGYFKSFNKN